MRMFIVLVMVVCCLSCNPQPEPLVFGQDACYTCKMTLMDNKFGAELVTRKGKVYKFDDVNCMLGFYHSAYESTDAYAYIQVVDFANPGHLIDGRNAWYLKSPNIHSPMASGVAAFESEASFQSYKKEWKAILLSWGEIQTQFK